MIMRFEDLNWMDVEAYLKRDKRLIIVLGATEQHGYLSLLSDVKIPQALADAASRQTGVLIAPPVNFGISPYFLAYPGTISLRISTFIDLVEDLVRSVYGYGFRQLLILNGHGGNEPARSRLTELANQLPDIRINWYSWWTARSVEELAARYKIKPSHENWLEAFTFTRVGDLPTGEKPIPAYKGLLSASQTRQVYNDGSFGGQYQVDPEIMDELFTTALQDELYLLEF
jgi:creatinine amidohydrolase